MSQNIPLLALRELVVFPEQVVALFVGREKSVRAIEDATRGGNKLVMLAAQRDARISNPGADDIYEYGTIGEVANFIRLADGPIKVLVKGKARAKINKFYDSDLFMTVDVTELDVTYNLDAELKALMRSVCTTFEAYVKLGKKISSERIVEFNAVEDPSKLADKIAVELNLKLEEKQEIIESVDPTVSLNKLLDHMKSEIEIMQVERKIRGRVKKQMEKSQKEYYLNEQMRAIQKELGDKDDFKNEIQELEEKLLSMDMPDEARDKTVKEIRKLKMMSPMSAEASVVRNYIDWMLSLPWNDVSQDLIDIDQAGQILDADHHGLERIKERILEYLAVQKLVGGLKGPILCLVGPPGVGKTSLGKSIARATNREFVRVALGGVRDEAEIRGHRRTYIGALPGKLMQSLKKATKSNPVLLLDEIDKMSSDFRGDPASALLEVLDPEQNVSFVDHYIDCDYDLSKVMFITTANTLHTIPQPLLDRMEVIRLSGYTELEKLYICRKHLIAKQVKENGLKDHQIDASDEALLEVIRSYTKESGVRNLERMISTLCRKAAIEVVQKGDDHQVKFTKENIVDYLGQPYYKANRGEEEPQVGTVTGLAWTEVGGVLLVIETSVLPGHGRLQITGKLGDVMQESAKAAFTYVRSRADMFGLPKYFSDKIDLHIHVPEGAIPKDGPSAGITIALSIVSALTGIPVSNEIAMTGEITLRGNVLPIGGLKEKTMAAHRAGCKKVLLPKDNENDIEEIPEVVRKDIELVPVKHVDEVIFEGLMVKGPKDFAELIEKNKARFELLFAEDRKSKQTDKSDDKSETIVAH